MNNANISADGKLRKIVPSSVHLINQDECAQRSFKRF